MNNEAPSPDAMIALSIGTAVPGLFGFFCPGPLDQGDHDRDNIKFQQAKAAVASLTLGVIGTCIAKKPWPFLVTVAMVGLLLWEYESQRKRPIND